MSDSTESSLEMSHSIEEKIRVIDEFDKKHARESSDIKEQKESGESLEAEQKQLTFEELEELRKIEERLYRVRKDLEVGLESSKAEQEQMSLGKLQEYGDEIDRELERNQEFEDEILRKREQIQEYRDRTARTWKELQKTWQSIGNEQTDWNLQGTRLHTEQEEPRVSFENSEAEQGETTSERIQQLDDEISCTHEELSKLWESSGVTPTKSDLEGSQQDEEKEKPKSESPLLGGEEYVESGYDDSSPDGDDDEPEKSKCEAGKHDQHDEQDKQDQHDERDKHDEQDQQDQHDNA